MWKQSQMACGSSGFSSAFRESRFSTSLSRSVTANRSSSNCGRALEIMLLMAMLSSRSSCSRRVNSVSSSSRSDFLVADLPRETRPKHSSISWSNSRLMASRFNLTLRIASKYWLRSRSLSTLSDSSNRASSTFSMSTRMRSLSPSTAKRLTAL